MGRGRGKGKRGGRGGGRRQFVSSLEEMQARNEREAAWAARKKAGSDDSDEDESDEEGGGGKGDDASGAGKDDGVAFARGGDDGEGSDSEESEEGEQHRKTKGVEGLIQIENPNAKPKAGKMIKLKDMDMSQAPAELSRREREAIEAERKKAHYMKLHAEGKTDEARVDMERLTLVRKRREEQAQRAKEEEAKAAEEEAKVKERAEKGTGTGKPALEKLNPLEIKKMNPTKLKELLKEREESLQGSKKDLITRLINWEKANHS